MKNFFVFMGMMVSLMFALPHSHPGQDPDGGFRIFVKGQDQIYAFTMDMIRCFKDCRHAVSLNPAEDVDPLEGKGLFTGIQKLESAKSRMTKWIDSSEEDIRKVAKRFSNALNDLISCSELMRKSYEKSKTFHSKLAVTKCKTGYQKIREATPLIVRVFFIQDKAKPGLSRERLRLILQFCENTFQKELAKIEKRPSAAMEEPFISPIFVLKLSLEESIEGMR